MNHHLPAKGAAAKAVGQQAHLDWQQEAAAAGIDLCQFNPDASLDERIAWALGQKLSIATVYTRYSSKRQHSTDDQLRACVEFAARNRMYAPPEFLSVDEGVKGRRVRRDGLDRLKDILERVCATVLLVFKVSRLFRHAYQGLQLVQEEVVERGLRAISVSQGIDTADSRRWKSMMQLHGLMDDMLLDTIGDHCRLGLEGLFVKGYTTGALPVGYYAAEVPNAPLTNRGLPRTEPKVEQRWTGLFREHFEFMRDGMPVRQGWLKWLAAGGPCDPRSTTGRMSVESYRAMLSNPAYTGRWTFGEKRNEWSTKRDSVRQVKQPDSEVTHRIREDLRIIDDSLFAAVQARFGAQMTGPRGPRQNKPPRLENLVTEFFVCPHCGGQRFYQAGPKCKGMQCGRSDCKNRHIVGRAEAVAAVCTALQELLRKRSKVIAEIICRAQQIDDTMVDDVARNITTLEGKVQILKAKINDFEDLLGVGSESDRADLKAKIRTARTERATIEAEVARLVAIREKSCSPITPTEVNSILADFGGLLERAAWGQLGDDVVYKAVSLFRQLTGGKIEVHFDRRPGRKRTTARGVFTPRLLATVAEATDTPVSQEDEAIVPVEVCLQKPPRMDRYAADVRELYEDQKLSFATIGKRLGIGCAGAWQAYRRYYEMRGEPMPPRRYNSDQRGKPE
jgi:DNA invertase Pin-like site-specific DNA recombinase